MKKVLLVIMSLLFLTSLGYAGYTKGYYKKSGRYVKGHYKTKANKTTFDNYSTKGNRNPYTGKKGTKKPKYKF